MGSFNFKSVGKTIDKIQDDSTSNVSTPSIFGIKTPLRCSGEYVFDVTYSLEEQIGDNLRNLVLTSRGERLGLYNYGANLKPLLHEFVSLDDFDSKAIVNIKSAVALWMPYIVLNDYASKVSDEDSSKNVAALKMLITYDIPAIELKNQATEITMYLP